MSRKAAIALRSHVCDRLKERFDISVDIDGFNELNTITQNGEVLYDSEIENCDFREVTFKDKKIVCIFDRKLQKVKTVLVPWTILSENNNKNELINKIFEGNLLFIKPNYGAFILLNCEYEYHIGVLHNSEIKPNIDLYKPMKYKVISEKKGKMIGKKKYF
jgi:hypothetical protein